MPGSSNTTEDFLDDLIERIAARVVERLPSPPPAAPPVAAPSDYLTTKQAAKALALSVSTLEGWRPRGTGPAWVRIGTAIRYSRADLNAWVAAHSEKRTSR